MNDVVLSWYTRSNNGLMVLLNFRKPCCQGVHQQPGRECGDTSVVRPDTIRLVLSLAISYGWILQQLDVKNAF